jgi:hypothetical protein
MADPQRLLTIRGVREGVAEIDLLAVKPLDGTAVEALHVKVQTSFRPIGYICPLTKNLLPLWVRREVLRCIAHPRC